jgi:hypothetical protein
MEPHTGAGEFVKHRRANVGTVIGTHEGVAVVVTEQQEDIGRRGIDLSDGWRGRSEQRKPAEHGRQCGAAQSGVEWPG